MKESFPKQSDPTESWSNLKTNEQVKDRVKFLLGSFVPHLYAEGSADDQKVILETEAYLERTGLKGASVSVDGEDIRVFFKAPNAPVNAESLDVTFNPFNKGTLQGS